MERRISRIHLVALLVTSLIFIIGLLLGWQLSYNAESQMKSDYEQFNEQLTNEIYTLEVLSLMGNSGESSCTILEKEFENFTQSTGEYAQSLGYLEDKLGKFDTRVMQLKSDYSLMQARNYLIVKQLDEECGVNHTIIIYFYTNENYATSTDQGIALGYALDGLPAIKEKTLIYHFDANLNNSVVDAFKEQYSIRVLPTMIINGQKYEGFRNSDECRRILTNLTSNQTSVVNASRSA